MFKPLIAGITALSLTLATATPLTAQGMTQEDAGKLLIGIAAIAVLGAALDQRQERAERRAQTVQRGINPNRSWSDLHDEETNNAQLRLLPRDCLRVVETRFGHHRMFGKRCMNQTYAFASTLPERCAVRVYTDAGPRNGFDPRCLREQGYRSDRRH